MSKKYEHFPYLDKEIDIAGLEPFELIIVFSPAVIGIIFFIILPSIFKIPIVFASFIGIAFMYVWVRKRKSNKNKGYIYREIVYNKTMSIKKIY